jgi:SAM-dependent methyltransferase
VTDYQPRSYWEARAAQFGSTYVGYLGQPAVTVANTEKFLPLLLDVLLPDHDIMKLLDFGCGSGRFSPELAARAEEYVGADISLTGLELAGEPPDNGRWLHIAADKMPFRTGYFDVAVAAFVQQHIPAEDWEGWVAPGLKRVVHKGGHIIVIDDLEGTAFHMHPRGPDATAEALHCSIEVLHIEGHHWCARLQRE